MKILFHNFKKNMKFDYQKNNFQIFHYRISLYYEYYDEYEFS